VIMMTAVTATMETKDSVIMMTAGTDITDAMETMRVVDMDVTVTTKTADLDTTESADLDTTESADMDVTILNVDSVDGNGYGRMLLNKVQQTKVC